MSDAVVGTKVKFPALEARQKMELREVLGPLVALANPLDYHTYIWNDPIAMTATFTSMLRRPVDLSLLVIDFPREDRCGESPGWRLAVDALLAACKSTGAKAGILATLPENLPEKLAEELMQSGVMAFSGVDDAVKALEAAAFIGKSRNRKTPLTILQPSTLNESPGVLSEADAKVLLAGAGLNIPESVTVKSPDQLASASRSLHFPLVLKGLGVAHKTEAGVVRIGLEDTAEVLEAAESMQKKRVTGFLLEEYVDDCVAELLVSIVRDPSFGLLLTIGAGGVMTELLSDVAHLLLPVEHDELVDALQQLKVWNLLGGYRGKSPANINAVIDAILKLQAFALDNARRLLELEINPLLCGENGAFVADALIIFAGDTK